MIGGLQKAGVFHAVDPATMDGVWQQVVGVPCLACNAGSPASVNGSIYTAAGPPAVLFGLGGATGLPQWTNSLEGVTSYSPVTVANGIVYVTDNGGFLNVFDARNGLPLLKRNLALDTGRSMINESSSGGVTVARNTIYVALADSVVAFRVGSGGGGVPGLPPAPELPAPPGGSSGTPIIAGPGAVATTYATPTVTVQQGGSATFTNLDVPQHDVRADNGSFSTPLIGTGQSAPVEGVEVLAPGAYGFYCSLHPNMTGTLQVTP